MVATAEKTKPQGKLKPSNLWRLNGVRVFSAGVARGQKWTADDIDAMVANGEQYASLIRPTVVIGHEEDQPLTRGLPSTVKQNTGEPAFGRPINFRKELGDDDTGKPATYLTVDFVDVPGWLARMIAGRQYTDVSAEIYETPPDGLEDAKGPILRRVALLGGELPQIKNLGHLPEPEVQQYGERVIPLSRYALRFSGITVRPRDHTCIVKFSESQIMTKPIKLKGKGRQFNDLPIKSQAVVRKFADEPATVPADAPAPAGVSRQDMLDALSGYGFDISAVTDVVPDATLAEMIRVLSSQIPTEKKSDDTGTAASGSVTPEGQMADSTPCKPMSEPATAVPPALAKPAGLDNDAQTPIKSMTVKYSETEKALLARMEAMQAKVEAHDRLVTQQVADAKKSRLESFAELQIKSGKLLPAEVDAGIIEMAMGLDAVAVHKFSDGKSETALDRWMRSIEARPALITYADRMKVGQGDTGSATADEALLKGHIQRFGETLKSQSITEEKLIAGFKAAKKLHPEMTAREYLGLPAVAA